MSNSDTKPFPAEKTFSSYNQEQGKAYAEIRRDYHPKVYQTVLDQHLSTDGKLHTLLDVGCGPGNVARSLGVNFAHVIGLDPSDGMIKTARSLGGSSATSEPIRYEVSTAEDLGQLQDSSIDLITIANAAHWFDMPRFWLRAAKVLKPGGSVAIWCSGDIRTDPSLPNSEAIQAAMDDYLLRYLQPYYERGNWMTRTRYTDLPMPWNITEPVSEFDEHTFFRKDWVPEEEPFFVGLPEADMDTFEKMMATHSAYTRWAQANPDIAGTDKDGIRILRKEIERLLQEAGVEKGREKTKGVVYGAVLVVKKKV
ncbi:S-adenosyl-L-methionine-dependent methyltransferase [Talaromyces proteolyticus]|uniref:S-adenosyl-L-methionine-dependent methyltransferase n=1 Tax=Talaromyces proteolyticus TaxID=1131652 RepID=A0AAD4KXW9_9EURO|nr:S-adenosyl-L-methionine-dependent methyltransferase [Talaromyces proteolyticus]KAH8698526.1 S-adenosyl-L-methionine-dependent methyltransferase [Talaromyces proteolyticus]